MINTNDIVKRWRDCRYMWHNGQPVNKVIEPLMDETIDMIERLQRIIERLQRATDEQFLIIQDYRLGASWKDSNRQEMSDRIAELEAELKKLTRKI